MSWPTADSFRGCRELWLDGRCPCCGMPLEDWHWDGVVHHPEAVAEDVMFCGRCISERHHEVDGTGFLSLLLEALLP